MPLSKLDGLLTRYQAADYLGVTADTLARWASHGEGPPYVKVGRLARYPVNQLSNWLAIRAVRPNAVKPGARP